MLTFVTICINLYTFVIVCISFHTFVNTIRYKSNHPHNIIPEYAGCQYRIYIISILCYRYSALIIPNDIRIILFIYCQAYNLKPNTNIIISIYLYLYCVLFVYILIYIPGYAECQYRKYITRYIIHNYYPIIYYRYTIEILLILFRIIIRILILPILFDDIIVYIIVYFIIFDYVDINTEYKCRIHIIRLLSRFISKSTFYIMPNNLSVPNIVP